MTNHYKVTEKLFSPFIQMTGITASFLLCTNLLTPMVISTVAWLLLKLRYKLEFVWSKTILHLDYGQIVPSAGLLVTHDQEERLTLQRVVLLTKGTWTGWRNGLTATS